MTGSVLGQIPQEIMMHSFATPSPVTLVVDVPAGRIRITAAVRDTTTVQVGPADPGKSRDVKLAGQVTAACEGGVVRVAGPAGHRVPGSSGAVEVTVAVPAGSRAEVTAASARFSTEGPLGEVVFDSKQAAVSVGQAAAVRLVTVDGDITAGRVGGDSEIRTVTGDIEVAEAAGRTLVLATQAGAITVTAAPGVSAVLDAGTTQGRIRNTLTNTGGTPALAIRATTTLGDITARSQ